MGLTIKLDNRLYVRGLPTELFYQITNRLTYPNPKFIEAEKGKRDTKWIERTIQSYEYEDGTLILPRGYCMEFFALVYSLGLSYQFVDTTNKEKTFSIDPQITPYSYQEKILKEALIYPGPNFIIQAPPSAGKTYTGMEYIRRMGQTALWVAHTKPIWEQGIEAAQEVLGLQKKDVGMIGQGKFRIGDQITVAVKDSIYRKKAEMEKARDKFGIVVLDEAHHAPARTWREIINIFASAKTFGLTATAYREDGLTEVLFDYLGPIVAVADRQLMYLEDKFVPPVYFQLDTEFYFPQVVFQSLVSKIIESYARNQLIINLTKTIMEFPRNAVLILSDRVDHVLELVRRLREEGLDALPYYGRDKMPALERNLVTERLLNETANLIVGTYKALSEGWSYNPVNYLILATPFKSSIRVEQCVGRSQRTHPGKTHSIIIDMCDRGSTATKQANKRALVAGGLGIELYATYYEPLIDYIRTTNEYI